MEYCGIIALVLLLCYSAYPGKVKRLESKVKRLEKKQKGDNYMSQLIDDLVGEQCTIKSEAILNFAGKTELEEAKYELIALLDADDEWMKICYTDKKNKQVTKLLRIEAIDEIEIEE